MGYTLRKMKVVMWKCLIMRRRHWLLTIFEILIPSLFFGLLFLAMSKNMNYSEVKPATIVDPIDSEVMSIGFNVINYCPKNNNVPKLIEEFKKLLKNANIELVGHDAEIDMMKQLANDTSQYKMGIVVESLSFDDATFSYTLRTDGFDTASLYPALSTRGPGNSYRPYIFKFLPVQMFLDRAFTKLISDKSENSWKLQFQPNPYPSYISISAFEDIVTLGLPAVTLFSFLFIFPLLLTKIVQEKLSGVKELQKMMGLPSWMIWYGFLFNSLLTAIISMILVIIGLLWSDIGFSIFKQSQLSVLFVLLFLYVTSCVFFCFVIASIFLKPTPSVTAGIAIWVMAYVYSFDVEQSASNGLKFLMTYYPGYAMKRAYELFGNFEVNGSGMTWRYLFSNGGNASLIPMGVLFLNMITSIVVLGIITWYLDNVRPGPYGLKKPYTFFLKKSYWKGSDSINKPLSTTDHSNYTSNFEPPPPNTKVGIKVRDLSKNFGNFVAVDNVSIDFYEGQITALLGHNGAGKTTTMSILTGMFPPSSGEVIVQDYNIFKYMNQFRDSLGLCPQHNLLFTYLSVIQHLIFFGMIKGLTRSEARFQGLELLTLLNMREKKNQPVSNLSGGMQRKLQLAIALIAKPKVLMLDEPTSGMDPESRREMWDLLLSMRGERTIIITTHFMEEADVLGDRIAIMDHGKIKCYGTTLFLKKIYGAGYQLTFLTNDKINVNAITDLIKSKVPDTVLHNTQSSQVSYTLPTQDTSNFPELFEKLENNKSNLGITSIGIACTTIEEVFLKVGELVANEKINSVDSKNGSLERGRHTDSYNEPLIHHKLEGFKLFVQRVKTLIKKRYIFFARSWIGNAIVCFQFLAVLVFLTFMTKLNADPSENPTLTFSPGLYPESTYFLQNNANDDNQIYSNYKSSVENLKTFDKRANLSAELLKIGDEDIHFYRTNLIAGASIANPDQRTTVLFNSVPSHASPLSLNMYSNALLKSVTPIQGAYIRTSNHPLNFEAVHICDAPQLMSVQLYMSIFVWIAVLLLVLPILFGGLFFAFPVVERVNNCKQLQLMTGTSWMTYWSSLFLFDLFVMAVLMFVGIIVISIVDVTKNHFIAYIPDMFVLLLLFLLFGTASILFTYSYSLVVKSKETIAYYHVLNIVLSPVIIFFIALKSNFSGLWALPSYVSQVLICILPLPSFLMALFHFLLLDLTRSRCHLCPDSKNLFEMCDMLKNKSYIRFPTDDESLLEPGYPLGPELIYLLISILVNIGIITFIELQIGGLIAKFLVQKYYDHEESSFDQPDGGVMSKDPDVLKEKDRVDGLMEGKRTSEEINMPIFIVQNLKKTFFCLKRKFGLLPVPYSFKAVRGVSFAVSPGECFGLLGVNGAGKTTTFRMLTGDTVCTNGNASLFGYPLNNKYKYLSGIGYCPQFNGINEKLTAEETLICFSELRGIPPQNSMPIINHWINVLGLKEYRHRVCGKYSGGNKRKLSTAMALIGDPPLVFLDEPTSGVDPISRHNLWAVLSQIQKTGQAIVLTSHSMDECEALCNRLTIMVRGEMQCLGNITYLKQRYGQGFTLMVKLRDDEPDRINQLKRQISDEFNQRIEIKDEHKGLIHYQILDINLNWSQLFSKLETIKRSFEIVEDYSLSDTTLEQVFIAFAKGKGQRHDHTTTVL